MKSCSSNFNTLAINATPFRKWILINARLYTMIDKHISIYRLFLIIAISSPSFFLSTMWRSKHFSLSLDVWKVELTSDVLRLLEYFQRIGIANIIYNWIILLGREIIFDTIIDHLFHVYHNYLAKILELHIQRLIQRWLNTWYQLSSSAILFLQHCLKVIYNILNQSSNIRVTIILLWTLKQQIKNLSLSKRREFPTWSLVLGSSD